LKSLENLEHLEVVNNEIYPDSNAPDAAERRQKIFEILPNLKWVDGTDEQGNELEEEDDDDIIPNGVADRLSDAGDDDEEDEDGDDEDGEEEEYSSDEEEEGPGLSALYGDPANINDEDDGDYDEEEDDEGDSPVEEEEDEEEEAEHPVRGKKRKLEDDEGTT